MDADHFSTAFKCCCWRDDGALTSQHPIWAVVNAYPYDVFSACYIFSVLKWCSHWKRPSYNLWVNVNGGKLGVWWSWLCGPIIYSGYWQHYLNILNQWRSPWSAGAGWSCERLKIYRVWRTTQQTSDTPSRLWRTSWGKGSLLSVKMQCLNGHDVTWDSQPTIGRGMVKTGYGNPLMAAAILFSGGLYSTFSLWASLLNLAFFGKQHFTKFNVKFCAPSSILLGRCRSRQCISFAEESKWKL